MRLGKHLASPLFLISTVMVIVVSCQTHKEQAFPIDIIRNFEQHEDMVVRLAQLEIDSSSLDTYKSFLKEEIEAAIALEAGVLSMYAVQDKSTPTHITILEIYRNDSAYQAHLSTAHFQKYKTGTQEMVASLELIDLDPVIFGIRTSEQIP